MYLLHDSRMHSTLQECNRHIHQGRYRPDPVTAKGGTFSQSDSKINGRRQKRTWKSERKVNEILLTVGGAVA